ncbi:MAG: PEP-CTERM-box response regulator transcription factor [Steroidobacteraceae bacterium]|nr:PEP-CTERM-box response regulator transcription factor [Steroidobacteraceae bacterium]
MSAKDANNRLLIVEDDPGMRSQLRWCFDSYEVLFAGNRTEALAAVRRSQPAVVLQDLGLPPDAEGVSEGFAALGEILEIAPQTKVIVVTGHHDKESSLRAIASGAIDFYQKPVDVDVLGLIVSRAFHIARLESELNASRVTEGRSAFGGLIAADDRMQQVCRIIEKVAPADVTVLILGESGTGKELLAQAVHKLSPRANEKFQAINCAAIPEALLESELFGYEKGAFTGAAKQTLGKVELADGGTLFLDEIGDMPMSLQAKLLRFLQDRVIERVGGRQTIPVNVRVVAATNQNLKQLISQQRFREDLFYRLSEVTLDVPPLRDRKADAVAIAHAFLRRYAAPLGRQLRGFTDEAIAAIGAYQWPGNVRELENKIKSAVLLAEGQVVGLTDLALPGTMDAAAPQTLRDVRNRAEREAITHALTVAAGNISRAADLLGVTRPTLYDLLEKHQVPTGTADRVTADSASVTTSRPGD